jgi:hypothetical protein
VKAVRKDKRFGEYIKSFGINMSTLFRESVSIILADEIEASEELAWKA